ncbi:MAG: hypothetical protein JSR98_04730 [Proteobacteria bacterium]|nr:hypothetical protein [Pseudomonadota bacterium]
MLGEMAELSLVVAKELASRLRASETPEEAVALAGAFQKVTRVVRLTLALDAKLERDAVRDARAEAPEDRALEADTQKAEAAAAERQRQQALAERPAHPIDAQKDRVSRLLNRLLWAESEGDSDEYDVLYDDLTARLDEAARDPAFLDLPIEVLAGRMIADMGLSGVLTLSVGDAPASAPQPANSG